jgi:hypothetical protein
LEVHRLLVAQQVGEMRPGIHPIIDIEDVVPSAFLVLSELPILRHEIENRQSESPVETYGTLVGVRIVWGLNFENVALHVTLILRHCLPSLKHMKEATTSAEISRARIQERNSQHRVEEAMRKLSVAFTAAAAILLTCSRPEGADLEAQR